MGVQICRHALDRVPLSLIIDDSTVLINLNYLWMRDRSRQTGEAHRWEDVPVVHPESFTREFAEWCLTNGVRGKFSVVPCPAAAGRIDVGLPYFAAWQQQEWLTMCREVITPAFDITPEMMTHTMVVDLDTCRPVEPICWEQSDWQKLPDDPELITRYIRTACEILCNVDLVPPGVTSPGGFGGKSLDLYAACTGEALRGLTGESVPYFFKRVITESPVPTPCWYGDAEAGTAVGEIIASTGDRTGSWTGYGEVDADYYITEDLSTGALVRAINDGDPAVMCSHWQGFYGLHAEDLRGFRALKTVVSRLADLDPEGEATRWRKCGEICHYACARELATVATGVDGLVVTTPILAPELTLSVDRADVAEVRVDGVPLRAAKRKRDFAAGTFHARNGSTLIAFDPKSRETRLEIVGTEGGQGSS